MANRIKHNHNRDGIDRRGFLECMAWAGSGMIWSIACGVPSSRAFGQPATDPQSALHFVQISDSHMGFNGPANQDVVATLQTAVDRINGIAGALDFIIHTGDLSHNAKPEQYDALDQILRGAKTKQVFYVPGEHDVVGDHGALYLERYGKTNGAAPGGWYSFDHKDVHFVGLNNSAMLDGMGSLGDDQLTWLESDLQGQSASRPIVVFAHIPLWAAYPEWRWATQDSERALTALKKFGSVTVLNGHIHQVMQKLEGSVTFHTAMSTAFPQPAPGTAKGPGPMKVSDEKLKSVLGITDVKSVSGAHSLAVVDSTLASD